MKICEDKLQFKWKSRGQKSLGRKANIFLKNNPPASYTADFIQFLI
jgi:hypothetical protein